ncbi:hypothetical protein C8R43DRAFT_955700 [Mycena crocata]|nr:hypothetical protein C8R43DRAFT_955700 [Mycena crocata]
MSSVLRTARCVFPQSCHANEEKLKRSAKEIFQEQLRLVGHDAEFERFRDVIRFMVCAIFKVGAPISAQSAESWGIFQDELKRMFSLFEDENGVDAMKSANRAEMNEEIKARWQKTPVKINEVPQPSGKVVAPSVHSKAVANLAIPPCRSASCQSYGSVLHFLDACTPPRGDLLPEVTRAGIDCSAWICSLHKWPRHNLVPFLINSFGKQEAGRVDWSLVKTLLAKLDEMEDEANVVHAF